MSGTIVSSLRASSVDACQGQRLSRRRRSPQVRFSQQAKGRSRPRQTSCGASASSPSSDSEALQILELETQLAARQKILNELVAAERYKEAAEERDSLDLLQLRLRKFAVAQNQARKARILYEPGQVFIHRHFHYRAVIARVDTKCEAAELWIKTMKVDGLPEGRDQPFYHSLVDTSSRPHGQTTYVAQENIVPAVPPPKIKHPLLDQLFTGFSEELQLYIPKAWVRKLYEDL